MKAVIISNSTTKRINMTRFNNQILHGTALKRAFPGATASQLDYYVKASLAEDKPEQIIICGAGGGGGGTNNLTKKKQSPQEITKEIMNIVETCHLSGIRTIYVSSLICRPYHTRERLMKSINC